MLDSPELVCAGQALFEYPATSILFSKSQRLRESCATVSSSYAYIPRIYGRLEVVICLLER
jgi:hypothetical protein